MMLQVKKLNKSFGGVRAVDERGREGPSRQPGRLQEGRGDGE